MLKLLLVRHGETSYNSEMRVQGGASDIPLSDDGMVQAQRLALALDDMQIDAIYSSPQSRARDTASAIANRRGLLVHLEPDLREIEAGDLEGRTVESLGVPLSHYLIEDGTGELPRLPGGEGLLQVQSRAWTVIERITAGRASGSIVVVSHYFTTLAVICRALDFPLSAARRLRLSPASLSTIGFTGDSRMLLSLNDSCHLNGDPPA